jgi:phage baseplate assembly protein W
VSSTIQTSKAANIKRYFIGFSTQNSLRTGVRTLYDIDLINVDLMTAFNTRVGERVMRPDYGCKLWDYLMEPQTAMLNDQIIQEAVRICQLDSRCNVQDVQVYTIDQGFQINITLQYLPWLVVATFTASFESADAMYYASTTGGQLLI